MNCPTCKTKMKLKMDMQLNEKYYDCGNCGFNEWMKEMVSGDAEKKSQCYQCIFNT